MVESHVGYEKVEKKRLELENKCWELCDEEGYELYDYWTINFENARRYRKEHNKYLRKNQ